MRLRSRSATEVRFWLPASLALQRLYCGGQLQLPIALLPCSSAMALQ